MLIVQKEARAGECMFKLVTGRLDELTREFQSLFHQLPEIVDGALSLSGCLDPQHGLDDSDITKLRYIALRLLLLHWAAFRRRIIRPLQQYPLKLFWLIKAPPKQFCAKRKRVAAELLGMDIKKLDTSTQKIRLLCEQGLICVRDSGMFPDVPSTSGSFLYGLLKGLARMMPADTQAVEGINSVVKLVGRRCPNISLELLASRLIIKRAISEDGSMRRQKKWSLIKSTAESLLQSIVGYNTAALAILSCETRFSTPPPAPLDSGADGVQRQPCLAITDLHAVLSVCADNMKGVLAGASSRASSSSASAGVEAEGPFGSMLSPAVIAWAKSYNLAWRRATSGASAKKNKAPAGEATRKPGLLLAVFQFGTGQPQSVQRTSVYAVVEKFSVSAMLSRVDIIDVNEQQSLQWNYEEHNCVESTLFFMTFHDECSRPDARVQVGCTWLSPARSVLLMPKLGRLEDRVLLDSVLADVKPCFEMCSLPHPPPQPVNRKEKKQSQTKRVKAKPKSKSKAATSMVAKRSHSPDHGDDPSDDDAGYVPDDCTYEDIELQTGSEADANNSNHEADGFAAAEIQQAGAGSSSKLPSAEVVQRASFELQRNAEFAPVGDLEEEALLLLVRQARSERNQKLQAGCSRPASRMGGLRGVIPEGPEQSLESQVAVQEVGDTVTADDPDAPSESDACEPHGDADLPPELALLLASETLVKLGRSGKMLAKWASGCHASLSAMQEYAKVKDLELGKDRNISLVLLKANQTTSGCRCVRCKWNDNSHEIIWAHWVNNTDKLLCLHEALMMCTEFCSCGLHLFCMNVTLWSVGD